MFIFDPKYLIIVGPTILLGILAQIWVKSAYARWSRVGIRAGLTGREVAANVLAHGGLGGAVAIERVHGWLSDHYDPRTRVLRLSPQVYDGRSVAAAAIAAHEAGHALQHAAHYAPLALRSAAVPMASIGSGFGVLLIILGLVFAVLRPAALIGIALFSVVVLFQLITLPVEFDASRRARLVLAESGIITDDEEAQGVGHVLTAAAMTYVAATIQSIATLLYYGLLIFGGNRRD